MSTDTSLAHAAAARTPTDPEALAAHQAISADGQALNTRQVAALADSASSQHRAEHIRGIVAATMSQLSANAAAVTVLSAQQWQTWALRLADGLELELKT